MYSDRNEANSKFMLGALLGVAAGFIGGILYAPKSGKETREDIKNGTKAAMSEADRRLHSAHDELAQLVEKADMQVRAMKSTVKTEALDKLALAKRARDQAAVVMTAMRSGQSNDEDLELAVKNAYASIDNLKRFLHK